jgi:hypothetical protein
MKLEITKEQCRRYAELEAKDAEIAELRAALVQALRQWKMYFEMIEGDPATEKSAEADLYRAAFALAHDT